MGEWSGTISDSAGVVVTANPSEGLWDAGTAWTVVEDLRIGTVGGDPDYQFGQVGSIAVSSTGDIFVSDRQAREVRVFSANGTLLHTIGEPGSGPDQFGAGTLEIMVSAGDTLLVPDNGNRRISRFLPDGTYLGSARMAVDVGQPLRYNWNPASNVMAVQLRPVGSASRPVTTETDAIRRVTTSGTFADTLMDVPRGGLLQNGGAVRFFTPEPIWDVTDSATVLFAVNDEYRLIDHDRDGKPHRVVTKPFERRVIGDRDIRTLFSFLDRRWIESGTPRSRLPELHSRVSFADHFPAFYTFQTGLQGTIWVQPIRYPGDLSDDEAEHYNFFEEFGAPVWDVFDADGRYLGGVEMPPRFQPRLFVKDLIYGVWRDDIDVQYIVRLRLNTAGRPASNPPHG